MEEFAYGPDGNRYARKTTWQDGGNTYTEQVRYIGTSEFIEDDSHPAIQTITKNRLTANILRVTIVGTTTDAFFEYAHRDHLGSIEVITDEAGNTKDNLAFEPFGARKASDWTSNIDSTELDDLLALDIDHPRRARGFTGHEHLDRAGFIHMNGRMFDPVLGRFLSPDPIISRPEFSQRWNRYSYVMNSPMSLVDPSGYTEHDDAVRANLPFGSSGVFAGDASIFLALVDIWTTPQGEREMEYLANLQQSIDEQSRRNEVGDSELQVGETSGPDLRSSAGFLTGLAIGNDFANGIDRLVPRGAEFGWANRHQLGIWWETGVLQQTASLNRPGARRFYPLTSNLADKISVGSRAAGILGVPLTLYTAKIDLDAGRPAPQVVAKSGLDVGAGVIIWSWPVGTFIGAAYYAASWKNPDLFYDVADAAGSGSSWYEEIVLPQVLGE